MQYDYKKYIERVTAQLSKNLESLDLKPDDVDNGETVDSDLLSLDCPEFDEEEENESKSD